MHRSLWCNAPESFTASSLLASSLSVWLSGISASVMHHHFFHISTTLVPESELISKNYPQNHLLSVFIKNEEQLLEVLSLFVMEQCVMTLMSLSLQMITYCFRRDAVNVKQALLSFPSRCSIFIAKLPNYLMDFLVYFSSVQNALKCLMF